MFLAKRRKKSGEGGGFSIDGKTLSGGVMLLGYFGALRLVSWFVNMKKVVEA